MRKKLLPPIAAFIALAIMVALGACSNEELMLDTKPIPNPQTGRTLSFTASMPSDDPTTRVALVQEADNSITLTWEVGDKLQLAFVQGATKVKHTVTLTAEDITHEGRRAKLLIEIPNEITDDTTFDLYGVYGGGKRTLSIDIGLPGNNEQGDVGIGSFYSGDALVLGDAGTNPYIKLPSNAGSATSLTDIQRRKDVMLYFESIAVDLKNPDISVMFQHLGSLFSITLKNTAATSLDNLKEVQLVGINNPENKNWAYNGATGGQTYDLITKEFNTTATVSNHISFRAAQNSVPADGTITFWGWYPPMPGNSWPELELQLIDATKNTIATSSNTKPARTSEVDAGKAYYFYATNDKEKLNFTNQYFNTDYAVNVPAMGTLSELLTEEQKNRITRLTVTGEINAADFEVMRKFMPNLTYLDLKSVTCEGDKIPDNALAYKTTITTVVFPESIIAIGDGAFYECTGLKGTLTLPNKLTTIGVEAFEECYGFTGSLTIPNNVTTIGNRAFWECKGFDGSLTLSDNLTAIGDEVFERCTGFTGSLTIPDKVITIGKEAFRECTGFTGSLTLSNKLTTIGNRAFRECSGFTGALTLPTSLNSIAKESFRECVGFTGSLTFPINLHTIGEGAFEKCSSFTGPLTIPDNIITIASDVFEKCSGFDGALTIPSGWITIPNRLFKGCSGLTGTLTLPPNLIEIKSSAFSGCSGLTGTLTIPTTVTNISNYAFNNCSGFTGSLIIPDNVIEIRENAFNGCSNISGQIVFPISLTTMHTEVFDGCDNITSYQFSHASLFPYDAGLDYYGNEIFMLPIGATVEVPPTLVETYKADTNWFSRHTIVGIGEQE